MERSVADAEPPSPTFRPPQPHGLSPILERNIKALYERRQREERSATLEQKIAQRITDFAGSMSFVYVHLIIYGSWIVANLNWVPGVRAWDPSFVVLAMVASVEAIFLSTFVLISQNRISATAERRADLDLQIDLLTEHEITKLAELVREIGERLGVAAADDPELAEVSRDVSPEAVLDEIEERTS